MYIKEEGEEISREELLWEEMRDREREKAAKKDFKKRINKLSKHLFLYQLLSIIFAFLYFFLLIFWWGIDLEADITQLKDPLKRFFLGDGIITIAGILLSFGMLLLRLRKEEAGERIFLLERKMPLRTLLYCVLLSLAFQGIFTYLNGIFEFLFNLFGLTLKEAFIAATDPGEDAAALFYTAIFAPLVEELIYRGLVLRYLEKYGKVFAILMSAMFFGLMHGNPTQAIFAFLFGILYGYIALEYSILWTIFLHIFNNLGLGILYPVLIGIFPAGFSFAAERIFEIIFILAAILWLLKKRGGIRNYLSEHRSLKGLYAGSFSSIWMIVFWLFNVLFMISIIKPI